MVPARMNPNVQQGSTGLATYIPLMCIAVLCTDVFALRKVFVTPSSMEGETKVQVEFFLWVAFLVYSFDAYNARTMERITRAENHAVTKPVIDKVVSCGGHRVGLAVLAAERAPPETLRVGHDSSKESGDPCVPEGCRQRSDLHIVDCMLAEGVPNKTSKVLEVMHSCIRLGHGDAAVKLFDQMLQTGACPKAHLIGKAVSHKFFKLVVETLDDNRIQEDGLRLLDLVQAHAIAPAPATQNRLLAAWKNQLPEVVLKYFLEMKDASIILSRWAYRYIVVAHERSDPEFALKIYSEMKASGIPLDLASYNAVLGARSQLGMLDEARELFLQMVDSALVPNEKTYGIMIKVYSASNHLKEAIALFETMREQCLEPDRYAYHHAIRSCITLQRFEYAMSLHNDMVQKNVPLLVSTLVLLSGACENAGWDALAAELMTDLARAKEAEAQHGPEA
jgi:pentatricopeptide repeat protein